PRSADRPVPHFPHAVLLPDFFPTLQRFAIEKRHPLGIGSHDLDNRTQDQHSRGTHGESIATGVHLRSPQVGSKRCETTGARALPDYLAGGTVLSSGTQSPFSVAKQLQHVLMILSD